MINILAIIIAIITLALMYRIESTGNLKLVWGVAASLTAFIILFIIKELKL